MARKRKKSLEASLETLNKIYKELAPPEKEAEKKKKVKKKLKKKPKTKRDKKRPKVVRKKIRKKIKKRVKEKVKKKVRKKVKRKVRKKIKRKVKRKVEKVQKTIKKKPRVVKKKETKKQKANPFVLNYLKKYKDKFSLGDLIGKISSAGYSKEEIDRALEFLGLGKKKPVKKLEKKIEKKKKKEKKPIQKEQPKEKKQPLKKEVKKEKEVKKIKKESAPTRKKQVVKAVNKKVKEVEQQVKKLIQKGKPVNKVILNYFKTHRDKYKVKDLTRKILAAGYPKKEVDRALEFLGLGKKKPVKREEKKEEVKKEKELKKKKKPEKKGKEKREEKKEKFREGKEERKGRVKLKKGKEKEIRVRKLGAGKPSEAEVRKCAENIRKIKKEMSKVLVGQEDIVDGLILGLLCDSHVLVEGVPGIAKTLAIRALAATSGCSVKRVQFTVDMLPTDIIGITSYTPQKGFEVIKGPIFANFIIGDEINRAPPKTQSALIEGMQEKQVTIGRERFPLPKPFFVMATENPIESAGVYPLPEAQIDRFLFKLLMGYPKEDEEKQVMETNITVKRFEEYDLKPVISPNEIVKMQKIVKKVYLAENIKSYILSIVRKTRNKDFKNAQYISYGSSPRASIGLFIASKARALMEGRNYVLPEDIKDVVFKVLRHRLILTYKATIEKISPDLLIKEILNSVKV